MVITATPSVIFDPILTKHPLEDLKSPNKISIIEIDEMHSYIGNKKITAGSGLLLIEIGRNSSIALLANATQKREKSSGKN